MHIRSIPYYRALLIPYTGAPTAVASAPSVQRVRGGSWRVLRRRRCVKLPTPYCSEGAARSVCAAMGHFFCNGVYSADGAERYYLCQQGSYTLQPESTSYVSVFEPSGAGCLDAPTSGCRTRNHVTYVNDIA